MNRNSDSYSSCSGSTSVCGEKEANRVTDMAHISEAYFQYFNEMVFQRWKNEVTQTLFDSSKISLQLKI